MNTDDINRLVEQLVKEKVNTTLTDSLIKRYIFEYLKDHVHSFNSIKTIKEGIGLAVNDIVKNNLSEIVKQTIVNNKYLESCINDEVKKVARDLIKQTIGDKIAKRLNVFLEVLDQQLRTKA